MNCPINDAAGPTEYAPMISSWLHVRPESS
jgi:hypothetical protein